jgi:hypothetical protein
MRTANRLTGLILGALFVVLGAAGIAVSWPSGLAGPPTPLFVVMSTNLMLAALHAAFGIGLVGAALAGQRASVRTNGLIGVALLVLGLAGLFLVGADVNPVAATSTANALHFGAAALLLLVSLGADRTDESPARPAS